MEPASDLIDKLDALMNKHGRRSQESVAEADELAGIPVLTEVVSTAPWDTPQAHSETVVIAAPTATLVSEPSGAHALPPEEAAEALAQEIFQQVLLRIEDRLGAALEQRLADQVTPLLHNILNALLTDIKQDIANHVGDGITAALQARYGIGVDPAHRLTSSSSLTEHPGPASDPL